MDFSFETQLKQGDRLAISGDPSQEEQLYQILGTEVADHDLLSSKLVSHEVTVTSPQFSNRTLKELAFTERHGCYLTHVSRSGIDFLINPDLTIQKGD